MAADDGRREELMRKGSSLKKLLEEGSFSTIDEFISVANQSYEA